MSIKITITGTELLAEEMAALPANLERDVILKMSQVAYDKMQEGAGRHSRSSGGKLFASVYNRSTGTPTGREVGHDLTHAPYARHVIEGTRPHPIFPKEKSVLRWAVGGKWVFARFIKRHPGYIGDDYLTRAANEAARQFAGIVESAIKAQK